jgi:alpha-mannosidase
MNRREWLAAATAFSAAMMAGFPAKRASAATKSVYLATYSHIDAAWLWPLQEGEQQADAVFRSVLDRLDEFPKLHFSESSASYYSWIRDTDPVTFSRLQAAISSRRWEALGGWWTEADTNVPSGEALMRQGYYGDDVLTRLSGSGAKVAFLPDSFGSSANLPAILRAQGFETFVVGRGTFPDGSAMPSGRFVWQGLGDASIVAYNNPAPGGLDDAVATVHAALAIETAEPLLVWFGLGDHGGGPSRNALLALQKVLDGPNPPDVRFSRFDDYFADKPPPTITRRGELQHVFAGAYCNAAEVKRSNFDAQRALVDAERFDVMAATIGASRALWPSLDDAWRTLLLNQHHDTISGTAIRASLEAAAAGNLAAATIARGAGELSLERIVDRIDHRDPGFQMVAVFNPLSHPVRAPVSYAFDAGTDLTRSGDDAVVAANQMIGSDGSDVPIQLASSDGELPGSLRSIAFVADVPAFGYAAYRFRRKHSQPAPLPTAATEPLTMDNGLLRVVIDSRTGQPASVVDVRTGEHLLHSGIRLVAFADRADTWGDPAVTVAPADELGVFRAHRVERLERGRVRDIIRTWATFRDSTVIQDWILYAGERVVRARVRASWYETRARLALSVPHGSNASMATYDIPFGRIDRALDDNVHSASSFVSITNRIGGIALITAGSHGLWASARDLGVTLLRSAPYASMSAVQTKLAVDEAQDTGEHEIRAAIAFGVGDARTVAREADAFEREFPVRWVGVHAGDLGSSATGMDVDPAVSVTSARRIDGGSTIIRIHDESGTAHPTWLSLGGAHWTGAIDAFGIEMVRTDANGGITVTDQV